MNRSGKVLWLTGISGSGKSTIAKMLEAHFISSGTACVVLDGDSLRSGLSKDLNFSDQDRKENIRRTSEVAKLIINSSCVAIVALISPFEEDRENAKQIIGRPQFIEVFIDCPIEVCEVRDTKGLYKKARQGEINNFTGISSRYEKPISPDVRIDTQMQDPEIAVQKIISFYQKLLNIGSMRN